VFFHVSFSPDLPELCLNQSELFTPSVAHVHCSRVCTCRCERKGSSSRRWLPTSTHSRSLLGEIVLLLGALSSSPIAFFPFGVANFLRLRTCLALVAPWHSTPRSERNTIGCLLPASPAAGQRYPHPKTLFAFSGKGIPLLSISA